MIYLDTHAVIWLYGGEVERFPKITANLIEKERLLISPICKLELQYLFETKRVKVRANQILSDLGASIGLKLCDLPFESVIEQSLQESWTRDPFDRVITAHARIRASKLVSKDRTIRKHYSGTIWE